MIQERPDFKTLDPSDILERLNTHEFQLSEKRDIYGPNYGRTRALKAKVVSSSEEESDSSSDDPEDIGKELAMLVKKFQKFTKRKASESLHDQAQGMMKLLLMTTRREHVTSAGKLDTISLSVHSGTMRRRRRRARNMILMTRRRRNTQSLLPSLPQSLHHTRRAHLARLVRLLARKWIQRRSLLLRRQRWSLRRSLTLALQVWL